MADHPSVDQFVADLAHDGAAAGTVRATRADLRGFIVWWETAFGQAWDPAAVMERDIRAWCRVRQEDDGVAPTTINRGLATLRRFGTWAVERGLARTNPARGMPLLPLPPPEPRALPAEGVDRLFRAAHRIAHAALSQRDLAILALLGYAGLRSQEACDLQLRDVDLAGGMVTVRRGKAGKGRRVPLHPTAIQLLDQYLRLVRCPGGAPPLGSEQEREPFLVGLDTTRSGQPLRLSLTTRQVRRVLQQLGDQAAALVTADLARETNLKRRTVLERLAQQFAHVSPHQLRHSVARRLLDSGAQLPEVQRVLGHSRLSTTGMYLTPTEDDVRASIARMDDPVKKKPYG